MPQQRGRQLQLCVFGLAFLALVSTVHAEGENEHSRANHENTPALGGENSHDGRHAEGRPGGASRDGPRREMVREHHEFNGRNVRRFNHEELASWRGGRWNNSCFGGRCGWWWFAGGQWYLYGAPTYPYPLAVSEVYYLEPVEAVPIRPYVAMPVIQTRPMPVAAAPQFLYYCDNPSGYYPQVTSCATSFREVAPPPPPR